MDNKNEKLREGKVMKKKRNNRVISCFLTVAVMCALLFSGCQETETSEKVKELNVITDASLRDQVEEAADQIMDLEEDWKIDVQILPESNAEREQQIKKLRTQIMAGKGPDVYLLDTAVDNAADPKIPLLENPYKTMQSGAFAALDRYMEKDTYWEESTYKKEFLKAGQYEGKQYILPLSVECFVMTSDPGAALPQGETLGDWLNEVRQSDDQQLKGAMYSLWVTAGRWFEPAADYEKGEVLFRKEAWQEFASSYMKIRSKEWEALSYTDESPYSIGNMRDFCRSGTDKNMQIVPDIEGRKMASVKAYGAVGMSSSYKQEAYEFLMLFLNDELEEKRGEQGLSTMITGYIDTFGVPVQESAFESYVLSSGQEEDIIPVFREIEGAYFVTDAERNLYAGISNLAFSKEGSGDNLEAEISKLAEEAQRDYEMMITE